MSVNPATVQSIVTVASAATKIIGGLRGQSASSRESDLQIEQANLARAESAAEAKRIANANRKFLKRQKLAFLKSGVTLEGSPLFTLDLTLKEGQEEVDAEARRGTAKARLFTAKAQQTSNQGRSSLIGPLIEGAGQIFNAFQKR